MYLLTNILTYQLTNLPTYLRAVLADEVGDGHERRDVDEALPHHSRVHAHRVAVVELVAARLEEGFLGLVQQLDHMLRLEQRQLLLVAHLL